MRVPGLPLGGEGLDELDFVGGGDGRREDAEQRGGAGKMAHGRNFARTRRRG